MNGRVHCRTGSLEKEPRQPPAKLIVHCRTGSLEMARLEDIPEDQRSLPYRQLRKVTGQADRGIPRSLPYRQLRKPATTD